MIGLGQIATTPAVFEMASSETLPLGFTVAKLVAGGERVTTATAVLTDSADRTATLPGAPTVTGTVITQVVDGSALQPGYRYRLAVSFTTHTDTTWTVALSIDVPF